MVFRLMKDSFGRPVIRALTALTLYAPWLMASDFPDGTSDFEVFRSEALDDLKEALESGNRSAMETSLRSTLEHFRQDFPHLDQKPDPEDEQIDVASLETESLAGESLISCDEVRTRYEEAVRIADQVLKVSGELLALLENSEDPVETGEEIARKSREVSELRAKFREAYPDSLQIQDRVLSYRWRVTPLYNIAELKPFREYVDSWSWDEEASDFREIHFAHFSWYKTDGPFSYQPQADREPDLSENNFRLSRLASPVMACLGDQSVFARASATVTYTLSPPGWMCRFGVFSCTDGKYYGRDTIKFALLGDS